MRRVAAGPCVVAAWLLVGCALPEPVAGPLGLAVAPAYTDAPGAPPFDADAPPWWRAFGDPLLAAAVEEAVGESPEVFQALARAAQSRAQAVIVGADALPSVGAGVNASATRQGFGDAGFSTAESYGIGLNVDWEIDLRGRLAAQTEAARLDYLASLEGLRAVRRSIAAQTAKSYFAVVEARLRAASASRSLEILTETARQVTNRVEAGVGAPSDKFLAQANQGSATATLAASTQAVEGSTRQLELLLRDYPSGTVETATALAPVPPLPATGLPADLLARRPDVLAAERQLRASGFRALSAERALLPAISLSGGVGTASDELKNILEGDFSFWSLAGNLLQPIFQGGRLRANVALNEAAQREAAEAYVATVLTAFAEVESALATRDDIATRVGGLCGAAEAARAAEEIAFNRYRQGVEPFLTVLESQQRALDTSLACIEARGDALDNHIDLLLALGGGFEAPAAPVPGAGAVILGNALTEGIE